MLYIEQNVILHKTKYQSVPVVVQVPIIIVTRVTRGENIFNNKIYIGDLASTTDVRCPAAKYRGEYREVPATL